MKQIQPFRCTYFVEFFAFGLAGLGLDGILSSVWRILAPLRMPIAIPLFLPWLGALGYGVFWCGGEILALGETHVSVRGQQHLDEAVAVLSSLEKQGYPFRVKPAYRGAKVYQDWFVKHGYQAYGTHWSAVGPTSVFHLTWSLGSPGPNRDLFAMAGIRYLTGDAKNIKALSVFRDPEGDKRLIRLPNGKSPQGSNNSWRYLLDTGADHYLRPLLSEPIPVVCNDTQWLWLAKSWIKRFLQKNRNTLRLIQLRIPGGELEESTLLEAATKLIYLDHTHLEQDRPALEKFARQGGKIISPVQIPGLDVALFDRAEGLLKSGPLVAQLKKQNIKRPDWEEKDPAFEVCTVRRQNNFGKSFQRFSFDVDCTQSTIAVLPMVRVPGWMALSNGAPLTTYPAGPNLTAVQLPRGAHRLIFFWQMPTWHQATLIVSLVALVIVLACFFLPRKWVF